MRALSLSLMALALGCGDPLSDCRIEALGREIEGVPPGPLHRGGQPCALCHSPAGGAEPEIALGGTIFGRAGDGAVYGGAGFWLHVTDSDGASGFLPEPSNCAGNFYVPRSFYDPAFPILVSIYASREDAVPVATMDGQIGRERSCAGCHAQLESPGSPGLVIAPTAAPPTELGCVPVPAAPPARAASCTGGEP